MPLSFTKMHGLGNDYIYIGLFEDAVAKSPALANPSALAKRISDRHRGVGGDGLILIAPPENPDAHVRMIMFNSDGSRGQMCGNGIRCVGKLAYERGWSRHNPMRVQTDAGVLTLELTLTASPAGGVVREVRVDMGEPILEPARIPVALDGDRVIRAPLPMPGRLLQMTCVSMGNPHAVIFVPGLRDIPLKDWGPQLEKHPLFPQRMNIHFAAVDHAEYIRMITWERGAGATQACGTGAAAVCVAGVLNELTKRKVTIKLPGGELRLEWDAATSHVFKTGPAEEVFSGIWP